MIYIYILYRSWESRPCFSSGLHELPCLQECHAALNILFGMLFLLFSHIARVSKLFLEAGLEVKFEIIMGEMRFVNSYNFGREFDSKGRPRGKGRKAGIALFLPFGDPVVIGFEQFNLICPQKYCRLEICGLWSDSKNSNTAGSLNWQSIVMYCVTYIETR